MQKRKRKKEVKLPKALGPPNKNWSWRCTVLSLYDTPIQSSSLIMRINQKHLTNTNYYMNTCQLGSQSLV